MVTSVWRDRSHCGLDKQVFHRSDRKIPGKLDQKIVLIGVVFQDRDRLLCLTAIVGCMNNKPGDLVPHHKQCHKGEIETTAVCYHLIFLITLFLPLITVKVLGAIFVVPSFS